MNLKHQCHLFGPTFVAVVLLLNLESIAAYGKFTDFQVSPISKHIQSLRQPVSCLTHSSSKFPQLVKNYQMKKNQNSKIGNFFFLGRHHMHKSLQQLCTYISVYIERERVTSSSSKIHSLVLVAVDQCVRRSVSSTKVAFCDGDSLDIPLTL